MDSKTAFCYFPTTVLAVDDNQEYLQSISILLGNHFPIISATDPLEAIAIAKKKCLPSDTFSAQAKNLLNSENPRRKFHALNQCILSNLAYAMDRSSYISVLLVDYSMPLMSGLELCKALKDINIKKIMVTGTADLALAVDALNAGIIDKFIIKDIDICDGILKEVIREQQDIYFKQLSQPVLSMLPTEKDLFSNKSFYEFIQTTKNTLKATDFFLLDKQGSYLFVDAKGQPTIAALISEDIFDIYYNLAVDYDAPANIINKIKNRTHFPYLLSKNQMKLPIDQWESVLLPAKIIPGMEKMYFSVMSHEKTREYLNQISQSREIFCLS